VRTATVPRHEEPSRTARFLHSQLPMVAVGLVMVAAVGLIAIDRWRRGSLVFGVATLMAAAFRLTLPEARVGALAVRSRLFDVTSLTTVGAVIVWLAVTIDPLGTG